MNRTTALLLSLCLITGTSLSTAEAQEEGEQTFSVDEVTFNLDWNDTQFDWSQNHCLDLGVGEGMSAERLSAVQRALQTGQGDDVLGLGLTLADLVARNHGGQVSLKAGESGVGCCVTLSLLRQPMAARA